MQLHRRPLGQPRKLTSEQEAELFDLHQSGAMSVRAIAEKFGISRFTIYPILGRELARRQAAQAEEGA